MYQYRVEFFGGKTDVVNAEYFTVTTGVAGDCSYADVYFYVTLAVPEDVFLSRHRNDLPVYRENLVAYARNPRLITCLGNAPEVNVAPPKGSGLDISVLPC